MNEKIVSIIMILLGLIALIFPVVSTQTIGVFTGMIVLLVGIGLLVAAIVTFNIFKLLGVICSVFAAICFIFAYHLMFNPEALADLITLIIYMVGFILIVLGLIIIFSNSIIGPFNLVGISTLLFGIITIFVGIFVNNPAVLGSIVGLWLLVSGLISLFAKKEENVGYKDYIDV